MFSLYERARAEQKLFGVPINADVTERPLYACATNFPLGNHLEKYGDIVFIHSCPK